MRSMVRLELSVDEMRHQVMHALIDHQGEIQKAVDAEIKRLIESGALEARIKDAVKRYIDCAIDDGVKGAITRWSLKSPTVERAVRDAVQDALWKTETE